jgi:3-oxoacyl-[acyl-carrier protein] reductase
MHGLIHWLAGAYGKRGITVNGVAPALIEETKMLPGSTADLAARTFHLHLHLPPLTRD